jgi:transposase
MCLEDRPILEQNAAGIDIGAREIFVAVPPDRDPNPVRVFPTFTENLQELAAWLLQCGVTTVAMESTGVYWIPLYDILEQRGIQPCLVNARHMKNVPGRRTDWHECQWLQFLHSVGLLRSAFRPEAQVCAVRTLRHTKGQQSSREAIPTRGLFPASQPHTDGRLSPPDEEQNRACSCHDCYRP